MYRRTEYQNKDSIGVKIIINHLLFYFINMYIDL